MKIEKTLTSFRLPYYVLQALGEMCEREEMSRPDMLEILIMERYGRLYGETAIKNITSKTFTWQKS